MAKVRIEEDVLRHQIERGDRWMRAAAIIAHWYLGTKPPDYIKSNGGDELAGRILSTVVQVTEQICPDCGSENVEYCCEEELWDCLDCGIWYDAMHPDVIRDQSLIRSPREGYKKREPAQKLPTYVEVMIPSEIRIGAWWSWGHYETVEEAIEELREAGIHVDDAGRLCLVNVLDDEMGLYTDDDYEEQFGEAYELAEDTAGDENDGVFHAIWNELEEGE